MAQVQVKFFSVNCKNELDHLGVVASEKIDELIVVKFEHGARNVDVELSLMVSRQLEDALKRARRQTGQGVIAYDRVRLSAARLPVSANANIVSIERRLDKSLPTREITRR